MLPELLHVATNFNWWKGQERPLKLDEQTDITLQQTLTGGKVKTNDDITLQQTLTAGGKVKIAPGDL